MANKKLEYASLYFSAPQVQKKLGLSRFQLDLRLTRHILPPPTFVDISGVRYFDARWLKTAKFILDGG